MSPMCNIKYAYTLQFNLTPLVMYVQIECNQAEIYVVFGNSSCQFIICMHSCKIFLSVIHPCYIYYC